MWSDQIIKEVREAREAHAAQYNYDLNLIFESIKKSEALSGRRYVTLPANRIIRANKTDSEE